MNSSISAPIISSHLKIYDFFKRELIPVSAQLPDDSAKQVFY